MKHLIVYVKSLSLSVYEERTNQFVTKARVREFNSQDYIDVKLLHRNRNGCPNIAEKIAIDANAREGSGRTKIYSPKSEPKTLSVREAAIEAGKKSDGKADTGKIRMSLLFVQFGEFLRGVAGVLTFGASKYPKPPLDNSWRDVPQGTQRYQDALYRHLDQYFVDGEENDVESGFHHLCHAVCNIIFIYALRKKQRCRNKQNSKSKD